jgi:DNA-binding transcriptional MerR regulator/methylmalonyl-CoA mutase cobalamin-binding subunit
MEIDERYPIRYVALRTGLSAHVIRAWERRYAAVTPRRSATNRRLYTESDVQRLQLLRKAVASGHSVSTVSRLGSEALFRLINRDAPTAAAAVTRSVGESAAALREDCLSAVRRLDLPALESALNRAAVALTRRRIIDDLVLGLFRIIGELWAAGELKIVNEHMATSAVRSFLGDMLRSTQLSRTRPNIVVTTPSGQWHELGALATAVTAADAGWYPIYLGPNLPAEEIAAAVDQTGAAAVAISVSHHLNLDRLRRELKRTRQFLGDGTAMLVGGSSEPTLVDLLATIDARRCSDLDAFRSHLDGLLVKTGPK